MTPANYPKNCESKTDCMRRVFLIEILRCQHFLNTFLTMSQPSPRHNNPLKMKSETIRIRKYPNRRLYDTSRSSFITSEQLFAMVQRGLRVEVVESNSQEDITNLVLLNLIMTNIPSCLQAMSSNVFHDMIKGELTLDSASKNFASNSSPKIELKAS